MTRGAVPVASCTIFPRSGLLGIVVPLLAIVSTGPSPVAAQAPHHCAGAASEQARKLLSTIHERALEPIENPFGPKVLPMCSAEWTVTHVSGIDRSEVARPARPELAEGQDSSASRSSPSDKT